MFVINTNTNKKYISQIKNNTETIVGVAYKATQTEDGLMSKEDKAKLDNITSMKGEQGDSAYQLYLKHTHDNPVLTEQQYATQYASVFQVLRTI